MKIENVYKNIKRFRELKSLTRDFVAAELEMTVSGYSKIERGEVDISISKLIKTTELLDVTLNRLLEFDINQILTGEVKKQTLIPGSTNTSIQYYGDALEEVTRNYIKLLESENNYLHELLKEYEDNISMQITS